MKNEEFSKEEVNWAEIDAKIQIIEENLTDLISKNNNFGDINGKLPLEDAIHLDIGLAYTINSIYYSMLRLNGKETKESQVIKEISNVEKLFERFNKVRGIKKEQAEGSRIDKRASGRIIQHYIGKIKNKGSKEVINLEAEEGENSSSSEEEEEMNKSKSKD